MGFAERRGGGLREEEGPLGRDVERSVPVGLRHLRDRLRHEARPCCVDDELEAAQLVDRLLHEHGGAVARAEVAVGPAGGDHRPPVGAQTLCDSVPDPSRSTRDERPAVCSL